MTFFFTSLFVILVFWRPQEWLVPWLYGLPMLDGIVVLALLSLVVELKEGRLRFPRELPQPGLLAGLFLAGIMSHAVHTYFAGMVWTAESLFKLCFFTLLLFCVLDRPSRLRTMSALFVAMGAMMAVHALMQKHLGYGFGGQGPMYVPAIGDREPQWRSLFYGIFEDPNDLAQILATAIPFAFAMFLKPNGLKRLLSVSLVILMVMGILATHSRGGAMALATVSVLTLALAMPPRWLPRIVIAMAVVGLAMCPFSEKLLDQSAHDRVVFWGEANWVFRHHPIFGVGHQMFPEYISGSRAAHNAFVLCYTELGVFGYWFWFVMVQLAVVGAWRARIALRARETEEERWLFRFSGVGLASISGFLVSAYFLSRTFVFPMFFLIAMLGVLPEIVRRLQMEKEPPDEQPFLIHYQRDVLFKGTLGTLISIGYIYVSIVLLNKAFYG